VQEIKDDLDRLDKASGPEWPRQRCHIDVAIAARIRGVAMADMAHGEVRLEAVELGRQSVYSGPVLFDLAIMFLLVRSFTDKQKGSNSMEHQLSVVKRRTERRL
jgi:hypothetical protein